MTQGSRGTYRSPLDAAQARIADLEAQLADARDEAAAPPEVRVRAAALRSARQSLVQRDRERRRSVLRGSLALGLTGTAVFTAIIASMGKSGHPWNALALGLCVTILLAVMGKLIVRPLAARTEAEVRVIDRELATLAASAAPTRQQAPEPPPPAVRVEIEPPASLAEQAEHEAEAEAQEVHQAHQAGRQTGG